MGRVWWPFLIGTLAGCGPRVAVESDGTDTATNATDAAGATLTGDTSAATSTSGGGVTSSNPSGPSPTGPSPTGPNPTSPVTSATAVGTTSGGTGGVDTGIAETGIAETGISFDLPPTTEMACIPVSLHGPAIEAHPGGWIAYEACDPGALILQTPGAPALLSPDEIAGASQTYGQALFGMPGAVATGIGPCCPSDAALCLTVDVQTAELQINESLAYASELFVALDPECVGLRFQLVD